MTYKCNGPDGATEREAGMFESRARARLESLRKAISDNSESMNFVFKVNEEEIKTSTSIIHALYPCLSMPQASLEKLASWTGTRQSKEAALAQLEEERKRVQATPATTRTVLWMQINLWPLILIAALSLKFSKGVAGLRKHREESRGRSGPPKLLDVANAPPVVSEPESPQTKAEFPPTGSASDRQQRDA